MCWKFDVSAPISRQTPKLYHTEELELDGLMMTEGAIILDPPGLTALLICWCRLVKEVLGELAAAVPADCEEADSLLDFPDLSFPSEPLPESLLLLSAAAVAAPP